MNLHPCKDCGDNISIVQRRCTWCLQIKLEGSLDNFREFHKDLKMLPKDHTEIYKNTVIGYYED